MKTYIKRLVSFLDYLSEWERLPEPTSGKKEHSRISAFFGYLFRPEELGVASPKPTPPSGKGFIAWLVSVDCLPEHEDTQPKPKEGSFLRWLFSAEEFPPAERIPNRRKKESFLKWLLAAETLDEAQGSKGESSLKH